MGEAVESTGRSVGLNAKRDAGEENVGGAGRRLRLADRVATRPRLCRVAVRAPRRESEHACHSGGNNLDARGHGHRVLLQRRLWPVSGREPGDPALHNTPTSNSLQPTRPQPQSFIRLQSVSAADARTPGVQVSLAPALADHTLALAASAPDARRLRPYRLVCVGV